MGIRKRVERLERRVSDLEATDIQAVQAERAEADYAAKALAGAEYERDQARALARKWMDECSRRNVELSAAKRDRDESMRQRSATSPSVPWWSVR